MNEDKLAIIFCLQHFYTSRVGLLKLKCNLHLCCYTWIFMNITIHVGLLEEIARIVILIFIFILILTRIIILILIIIIIIIIINIIIIIIIIIIIYYYYYYYYYY